MLKVFQLAALLRISISMHAVYKGTMRGEKAVVHFSSLDSTPWLCVKVCHHIHLSDRSSSASHQILIYLLSILGVHTLILIGIKH